MSVYVYKEIMCGYSWTNDSWVKKLTDKNKHKNKNLLKSKLCI